MRFESLVTASARVAATSSRNEKVEILAALFRALEPGEIAPATAFLSGRVGRTRIGLGWAAIEVTLDVPPAPAATLELREVAETFRRIEATTGAGSQAARRRLLRALFARATRSEQDFLRRLIAGEIRQGALEGLLIEAVAQAAGVSPEEVRRAVMFAGALEPVAEAVLAEGRAGLARFDLSVFQPVRSMLASPADDVEGALIELGEAAVEYKLDGARVQVHKSGGEVRVFSRRLNDVTQSVPEIVEAARALPARELILDGEALALDPAGRPQPFQVTMRRFGRKLDVERMRRSLPLSVWFFDCLRFDGETLLDRPLRDRSAALAVAVPESLRIPRRITADPREAAAFYEEAVARGHEGVLVKSLASPYEAGVRGRSWLKVKRVETFDLVVLAAEWGHGRRRGFLSNLHLGARDPRTGGFVMVGKTFKGLTDEMLRWQTDRLLALETHREGHVVYVRPELVVEVAVGDVERSPRYPGGVALRFARVRRYREDKKPQEADTIDRIRALAPEVEPGRRRGPGDAEP